MVDESLLQEEGPHVAIQEQLSTSGHDVLSSWVVLGNRLGDVLYGINYFQLEIQDLQNSVVDLNQVVIKHLGPLLVRKQSHRICRITASYPHFCIVLGYVSGLR